MKKKVLFSILGIALFAVVIGFGVNDRQEENLEVKNIEALAKQHMKYPVCCDDIWSVTYSTSKISCTTGGGYDCPLCCL